MHELLPVLGNTAKCQVPIKYLFRRKYIAGDRKVSLFTQVNSDRYDQSRFAWLGPQHLAQSKSNDLTVVLTIRCLINYVMQVVSTYTQEKDSNKKQVLSATSVLNALKFPAFTLTAGVTTTYYNFLKYLTGHKKKS